MSVSPQPRSAAAWAGFRYAMCNESMQGMKWREQCELLATAGYRGIEIAPFSLVEKSVEEITPKKRRAMLDCLKDSGLQCAGLHWLLSPPPKGLHVTHPDQKIRKKSWEYLDRLIDFCADLGGKVMVFGSPKGRSTVQGASVPEATKFLSGGLAGVADHAEQRGVRILLEALTKNQTDVVNTMEEAVRIVEEIGKPAIQTLFDFHNTVDEKIPMPEIVKTFYSRIFHVHVQEMDGNYLGAGSGSRDFVKVFQVLKDMQYERWVSLEVFDFSPGPKAIAKESMRTLKAIEGKLK
ncbi:MAG TPA: sugar phosphate isomerase/epimerase family protein [Thermodesulfobacteriota bacterium]|nr:sugar phosphate isomerase/epimerase family protein [Thermodesulfobacteriota bacterium]